MGKRSLRTPRSKVRAAVRRLWLQSRERSTALKRDKYTCQKCGKKQSKRKGQEVAVNVHHLKSINWESIIDYICDTLLCDPEFLQTLCLACHDKEEGHSKGGKNAKEGDVRGVPFNRKSRSAVSSRVEQRHFDYRAEPRKDRSRKEDPICRALGLIDEEGDI